MKRTLTILFIVALLAGCGQQSSELNELKAKYTKLQCNFKETDGLLAIFIRQTPTDKLVKVFDEWNAQQKTEEENFTNPPLRHSNADNVDKVDGLQIDAYGPGIHKDRYGRPVILRPDFGGVEGEHLQIKLDAYGPGVHSDQYGRPVREYPR